MHIIYLLFMFYTKETFTKNSKNPTFTTYISHNIKYIGFIIWYVENSECNILYMEIYNSHKGKGFGSKLLKYVIDACTKKNVKLIKLDDCSENYLKPNNIYIKHNFQYINKPYPEMVKYL